jgi:hypothetical protein
LDPFLLARILKADNSEMGPASITRPEPEQALLFLLTAALINGQSGRCLSPSSGNTRIVSLPCEFLKRQHEYRIAQDLSRETQFSSYSVASLPAKKPDWLLVKMRDEEADSRRNPAKIETKSALSGRTMKQIKEEAEESRTALLN